MRISFLIFLCFIGHFVIGQDVDIQQSDDVYFTQYKAENNSLTVNQIKIDNNNRIIVATDKMLFTITSVGDIPKKILNKTYVKSVAYDEASNIYAAGKNSIYDIKNNINAYLPDTNLNIIDIEVLNDDLWVGTDSGLYKYSITNKNWDEYNKRNSKLLSNRINFVDKDENGVVWVGTAAGYVRIKDGKWDIEDKKHDLNATRANKEGQWMVSSKDMWLIDKFNRKYDVGLENNMHVGRVNDFVIDSKGRIYMASDILVRYDPYQETIEQYGEDVGIISRKCITLAADKNDNIWLGTADAGLFKMTFGAKKPDALTATILLENGLSCSGNKNASFVVSTGGGIAPYSYKWNDGSTEGIRRKGLGKGVYNLTVTDDAGNTAEASMEITEPTPIDIDVLEKQDISDKGAKDGAITVSAKGGTGKLSYNWSNGMTGANINRLSPGSFILTVKDQNNCTAIKEISIGDAKNLPQLTQGTFEVGNILTINNLTFQADSSNIVAENYGILNEVYSFLKKNPRVVIEIGGHTNTIPPHKYCDRLSTLRAKSVAEYIINQGIEPSRVTYKGYGKRKPLIDSRSLEARKKNQRVEIKILQT